MQESSRGISVSPIVVGFIGSDPGWTLKGLIVYESGSPFELQLKADIPPVSKSRYPDFVGSPLQATLAVPPAQYGAIVSLPPSGLRTILPQRKGHKEIYHEAKRKKYMRAWQNWSVMEYLEV